MAYSTITIKTANGYKLRGQLVRYPKNQSGQLVFCGEGHSVNEVYGRPSSTKQQAEKDILAEMYNAGGWGYTVLGHNGFYFSCGYYVKDGAGVLYFVKHTAGGRFICECDKRGQYISSAKIAGIDGLDISKLYLDTFYISVDDIRDVLKEKKAAAFKNIKNNPTNKYHNNDYDYMIIELCDNMSGALDIFENNGGHYCMSFDAWAHWLHNEAEKDAAADYIAAAWPCL